MNVIYRYYRAEIYDKKTEKLIQVTTYLSMKNLLDFISSFNSYTNDYFFIKIIPTHKKEKIWWIDDTEETDIIFEENA